MTTPPDRAPEWIDASPDAPHARDPHARWAAQWTWLKLAGIALAAACLALVVRGRQAATQVPPIQVSALPTPTASTPPSVSPSTSRAIVNASPAPTAPRKRVLVHVVGRVRRPGVFEMGEGARLKDALHQAGGALPGADLEAINLAEPLEDGRQYRVPEAGEAQPAPATRASRPQALARPQPRAAVREAAPEPKTKAPAAPLDLNSADLAQLETLPGVGPATAKKILEQRDAEGGFKSVDDLDAVPGIGPKKLESIRPHVFVR